MIFSIKLKNFKLTYYMCMTEVNDMIYMYVSINVHDNFNLKKLIVKVFDHIYRL